MQLPLSAIAPWRQAAIVGVSLLMAPLWVAANPACWMTYGSHDFLVFAMSTAVGAAFVGGVFLVVATIKGRAPSLLFGLIVPGIGVLGFAFAAALPMAPYGYWPNFISYCYTGVLWSYLIGLLITFPLATLHTLLMIGVACPRTPRGTEPNP